MLFALLANLTVLLHLGFVLFVVLGGALLWRWHALAWLHLPAAAWGALVEFTGWLCPLTALENALWRRAGAAGYDGGFVEHYLLGLLYPQGLTRGTQLALGAGVLALNLGVYAWLLLRHRAASRGELA